MAKIRKNIMRLILALAGALALLGLTYAALRTVIFTSFEKIERQNAVEAMARCESAFNSEVARVSAICHDWGFWDDAYEFVQGQNPAFIESNLSNAIFENNQINLVCISHKEGKILNVMGYDLDTKTNFKFKDLSGEKIQGDFLKMLRLPALESKLLEIIPTEKGPLIVNSNPILTTHGEGPANGVLLMGRLVDKRLADEISMKTGYDVNLELSGVNIGPDAARQELVAFGNETYKLKELSRDFLQVSWAKADIDGKPAFALSIKFKRDITGQGRFAIWISMLVLAGLGLLFMVIVNMAMAKYVSGDQPVPMRGWTKRHKLLVLVIMLSGFSISLLLFYVFREKDEIIQLKDFERNHAGPAAASIQQKLDLLESNIDYIAKFYDADEEVSREEFQIFTGHMLDVDKYLRALDWVPLVLRSERLEYEKKASLELDREFYFTEKSTEGKMVRTGERDEYFPVYYFEPRNGNQASAGFDNYSESSRKAVLDKARSSGKRELAINLSLVQDKVKKAGFLYFQPVYKKNKPVGKAEERTVNIKGFIAAVFHLDDLVNSIVSEISGRDMVLEIFEEAESGKDKVLIYSNAARPADINGHGDFVRKFYFGGRHLMVVCHATAEFMAGNTGKTPFYMMAISLLFTVIMAMLVYLQIQRTLKEGEKQYRLLFDEMMSGFALHEIICDDKGVPVDYRFLAVNEAFEKLTGLKAADIVGKRVMEALPATEKHWIERYGKVALTGESAQFEEYSASTGKYFEARAFRPDEGRFAVIFNDITERKKHEDALLNAAKEWRTTFDAVSDILWLLDKDQRIVRCNRATREFLGKEYSDIIGKHCWEIIHGTMAPIADCPILRMNKTKQKESQELKIGNNWYLVKVDPILDDKGDVTGAVHIVSDITSRKLSEDEKIKLEEQLHHAQKMESIGKLAGGVAHDFNNLLTPIIGYADVLKMDMPAGDSRREYVNEIKGAAERAKDLTRQLLAFGRKQMLELKNIDLGEIITNIEKMLRRTIREDIRIEVIQSGCIGRVKADIGQIEQVLMNLAVNAQDAMFKGGLLQIRLENVHLEKDELDEYQDIIPGEFVCLSVSDTGHGMDKAVMDHIFEPFFTTKEMGRGTGLGLSTVYGIVKQHHGHVKVFSEIGKGTTFKIYLPVSHEEDELPVSAISEKDGAGKAKGKSLGGETILLVEDNEMVKNIATLLLESQGYRTIGFGSGEDCVRYISDCSEHVDLLLTDVIMPSMNGKELYERIRKKRPELKVLYMSGYDRDVIARHGVVGAGIHFLQKPFTAESIVEKVRETLES